MNVTAKKSSCYIVYDDSMCIYHLIYVFQILDLGQPSPWPTNMYMAHGSYIIARQKSLYIIEVL